MKKLYTLLSLLFVGTALMAQVSVTYRVDITDYLAGGTALSPNGMRIGGNFADVVNSSNVVNWTPSDANSAMTQRGTTNVWSITVVYPASSIGTNQKFKFVNGDWGTNEGSADLVTDGCASQDGGDVNRNLVIPTADVTYEFCFDKCTKCDGSNPLITSGLANITSEKSAIGNAPNPFSDKTVFTYSVAGSAKNVTLSIIDITGRLISTLVNEVKAPGVYNVEYNGDSQTGALLGNGIYFYSLNSGNDVVTGKLSINR